MITASCYGRVGRDPDTRETRSGKSMTTASLAVDVTGYGAEGNVTCWLSVCAFGQAAEALAQHAKGDMVAAAGRLTLRQWSDREGQARESWQLTVDALHSSRTVQPRGGRRWQREETETAGVDPDFNDEIPF